MSSATAPRSSLGHRGHPRNQKRCVVKSDGSSSLLSPSGDNSTSSNPPPPLTTSLRGSSPASHRTVDKGDRGSGYFVNFLPQDEAVASGLGVEEGGLDAVESQGVVDLLNDELSRLLKMKPRDFWREVASNESLREFLDSYLQFRNRWYDFSHRGTREIVAGVIVGEAELSRRVFMVFYRISSNKDPGARASESLSAKEHAAILQDNKLLDLPKLLDICAIYGHDNEELSRLLVNNAIKAQPRLVENLTRPVSQFLRIAHTMHQRCSSSVKVLFSSGGTEDHGHNRLCADFLEVMDFINDAIVTMDAFADACKPAAMYFCSPPDISQENEDLLSTLAMLHDSLLPSLEQGFALISSNREEELEKSVVGTLSNVALGLKMLSMRIVKFGWKLLDFSYLSDELNEDSLALKDAIKMFPGKVEDPLIRGEILVQTFREINGEAAYNPELTQSNGTFLQKIEKNYNLLSRIASLRCKGWIFMDDAQFNYLSQIVVLLHSNVLEVDPKVQKYLSSDKLQMDEDAIFMESKITQIKDLFPDYGKGFLAACLEVYNQNPEEVIQRILDGTLHEDLLSLDTSLEQVPVKSAPHGRNDKVKGALSDSATHSRNDKGKGVMPEYSASHNISDRGKEIFVESTSQANTFPPRVDFLKRQGDTDSPSSIASQYGRYTRKTDADLPDSEVLDLKMAKDSVRSAVLAAAEYEDEYDDSFDDLGLSVVESGFEEAESTAEKNSSSHRYSENGSSNSSRWSSQKQPQFYVRDGKNYSYKVSGGVAARNVQEAAILNEAQKELIHGLGRGGNIAQGAVGRLLDLEKQNHGGSGDVENTGRGDSNFRGRGGRRGGRNHHRKDRAMKKHFTGLTGT